MIRSLTYSPASFNHNIDFSKKASVLTPITYAKSGTHMLYKAIQLLGISKNIEVNHIPGLFKKHPNKSLEQVFNPKRKYVILVRDPRDQLISALRYAMRPGYIDSQLGDPNGKIKSLDEKDNIAAYKKWRSSSMTDKLDGVFNLRKRHNPLLKKWFSRCPHYPKQCDTLVKIKSLDLPNILLIRFEDLIGPKGNATETEQFQAFKKICDFAGVSRSEDQINLAMTKLYGGTNTFTPNKKKVGGWVNHFEDRHILKAQEQYTKMLLSFGYETEEEWSLKYLKEGSELQEAC